MGRFDDFNKAINAEGIRKIVADNGTGEYKEVPAGEHIGKFVKLEVGAWGPNTSAPGTPYLKVGFKITDKESEYHNGYIKNNPPLFTAKATDKWNNDKLIKLALNWLTSLKPSEDIEVVFEDNYEQFEDLILDIAEDIAELEYKVKYDPDGFMFNRIKVIDVYE